MFKCRSVLYQIVAPACQHDASLCLLRGGISFCIHYSKQAEGGWVASPSVATNQTWRWKCRLTRRDVTELLFLCHRGICHLWLQGRIRKTNRRVCFAFVVLPAAVNFALSYNIRAAVVFRVRYPDRPSKSRHRCCVALSWRVNSSSMIHHVEFTPGWMARIQPLQPEAVWNFFQICIFTFSQCRFFRNWMLLRFFFSGVNTCHTQICHFTQPPFTFVMFGWSKCPHMM